MYRNKKQNVIGQADAPDTGFFLTTARLATHALLFRWKRKSTWV